MIRLTTALLTLGVSVAAATTSIAQGQNECFYGSCNPEAPWCRLLCGSGPQYQNVRSQWHHQHAKHQPCRRIQKTTRVACPKDGSDPGFVHAVAHRQSAA
jgi:hypothetical protein